MYWLLVSLFMTLCQKLLSLVTGSTSFSNLGYAYAYQNKQTFPGGVININ